MVRRNSTRRGGVLVAPGVNRGQRTCHGPGPLMSWPWKAHYYRPEIFASFSDDHMPSNQNNVIPSVTFRVYWNLCWSDWFFRRVRHLAKNYDRFRKTTFDLSPCCERHQRVLQTDPTPVFTRERCLSRERIVGKGSVHCKRL